MELRNLYQTVKDNGNPDFVEAHGAFKCTTSPWLGEGYYFWDNLLSRAHWWGESHYRGQYMICEACACIDSDKFLDLAGNMEQVNWFRKCYHAINEKHNGRVKTVSFVIAKLQKDTDFTYDAIRVISENCGGKDTKVPFVEWNKSYLNLSPPMQICIYDKSRITDYHIIYPEEYTYEVI